MGTSKDDYMNEGDRAFDKAIDNLSEIEKDIEPKNKFLGVTINHKHSKESLDQRRRSADRFAQRSVDNYRIKPERKKSEEEVSHFREKYREYSEKSHKVSEKISKRKDTTLEVIGRHFKPARALGAAASTGDLLPGNDD